MVYTMDRLRHAVIVFQESTAYRSRHNLASANLEALLSSQDPEVNNKRHNTRGAAVLKPKPFLWCDEKYCDTSSDDGEYQEPVKGRKRKKVAPVNVSAVVKVRRNKDGDDEEDDADGERKERRRKQKQKRRIMTWRRGRLEGKQLKLTLQLPSEKGRALLREMVEKFGVGNVDDDEEEDPSPGPSSSQQSQDATGREDALACSAMTVTQGTTMAKLKTFAATGQRLNALPPTATEIVARRRALEDLANDDHEDGDGGPRCDLQRRYLRNRVVSTTKEKTTTDKSDSGKKEPLSKILHFEVPIEKKTKADTSPPRRLPNVGTSFNDPWVIDTDSEQEISTPDSPSTPTSQSEESGRTKMITTSWAHPINFNYIQGSSTEICHFCADYRYGILGCGKIDVRVIQYGSSLEYIETGGGHVDNGHKPTRMCTLCALRSIHTSNCPSHKMCKMKVDLAALDYRGWIAHLDMTAPERERRPRHPACSICQHPAAYGCRAGENEVDYDGPFTSGRKLKRRCTLQLCGGCLEALKEVDWDRERLESDIDARGGLVRADMEFLFSGSDLHKAWGVKEGSGSAISSRKDSVRLHGSK